MKQAKSDKAQTKTMLAQSDHTPSDRHNKTVVHRSYTPGIITMQHDTQPYELTRKKRVPGPEDIFSDHGRQALQTN